MLLIAGQADVLRSYRRDWEDAYAHIRYAISQLSASSTRESIEEADLLGINDLFVHER
ncbi:hypothetical protein CPter91_4737 [Collimonas pratensis]|uniref:Uncharacterized protein n=1 Tax=Collimonas pratensis TaxID=279113 RepID=A0A127QAK1_9BURK|nr:hypothetical protein CPter91_4737 [Collimonas pratensis]